MRIWVVVLAVVLAASCAGDDGDVAAEASTSTSSPATTAAPGPAYPDSVEPVASPGCGRSTAGPLTRERRTLQVAGQERWFLLSVPSAHDGKTPLPLVLDIHGLAQGAEHIATTTLVDVQGEEEGYVTVHPQGTGAPVRWNQRLDDPANADLAFFTQMLDTLGDELCIDEARVYSMGLSYGAIMSSALACAMSDRIAAIAPVAGVEHPAACRPERPVPVLAFHGTADPILLFNGGVGDLGAALSGADVTLPDRPVDLDGPGYPAAVAAWAAANGCGEPTDEDRTPSVIDRSFDCPPEGEVAFVIIEGGGHTWPGSEAFAGLERIAGATSDEVDATAEAWRFFQRHALAPPRP